MKKRGLSDVVTTVLIILLVLAAVVIMWAFIRPFVVSSTERISASEFTTSLSISSVEIIDAVKMRVRVERGAGEGEISSLKIVLSDSVQSKVYDFENVNLEELESESFDIALEFMPDEVKVFPVILTESGKEITASVGTTAVSSSFEEGDGESMIAYYKLDGNFLDSSGKNNDGTMMGTVGFSGGQRGQAASFDGAPANYIHVPGSMGMDGLTEFTIAVWAKSDEVPFIGNRGIFGRGLSSTRRPWILGSNNPAYPEEVIICIDTTTGPNCDGFLRTGDLVQGEWAHIVYTWGYDEVLSNVRVKVYLDGVKVATEDVTTGTVLDSAGSGRIGNNNGIGSWLGELDELRIYNRALTAEEVALIYNA
jgi:hypothetical protein